MVVNLLIAATQLDARNVKAAWPQYAAHVVATPRSVPRGIQVGSYLWTYQAANLPARTRMKLRGLLAPAMTEDSCEEVFPEEILAW